MVNWNLGSLYYREGRGLWLKQFYSANSAYAADRKKLSDSSQYRQFDSNVSISKPDGVSRNQVHSGPEVIKIFHAR